ncbi:MAG: hypothetical protein E7679_02270 [Ruminococcaceae bacterium]|nr:hypothetical protein [Oscillospiraceae bacterium]
MYNEIVANNDETAQMKSKRTSPVIFSHGAEYHLLKTRKKGMVINMTGNQNKLPPKKDTQYLPPYDTQRFETIQRNKIERWRKIYILTTLAVVTLTVLFLAVGIAEKVTSSKFDTLADLFLSNTFMDISGQSKTPSEQLPDDNADIFDTPGGIMIPSKDPDDSNSVIVPDNNTQTTAPNDPQKEPASIYDFDYSQVPEGETPIIPMDLSLSSEGSAYIYNSTGYSPDLKALLASDLSPSNDTLYISNTKAPLVLIVHTHGTEAYSKDGAISYLDNGGELARSEDTSKNVVAVGAVMAEVLTQNGIPTLHCTIMHDQLQYKDSYSRAEATIKQYLEKYPSIKLVIDLHRDAIIKSSGELVRPVTAVDSKPTAQVMCVVGSDWGGEACPSWQNNLALALKLRDSLNSKYGNLCRPTYLRTSTYNQELAPYSLLLEIGACGNSLEEAKRAAELVAIELIPLIKMM